MSGQIRVNYDEVYESISQIRSDITTKITEVNEQYNKLLSDAAHLDSASNAALITAIKRNVNKAEVTAELLDKLLSFINNSTKQVQFEEARIASRFHPY
jgi:hypothetical protein